MKKFNFEVNEKQKTKENLIVILLTLVAICITIAINIWSLNKEYDANYKILESNLERMSELEREQKDNHIKDLLLISIAMSKSSDSSTFDDCLDKFRNDFNNIEFVGLSHAGKIEKIYPASSNSLIGKDIKVLNRKFFEKYTSKLGVEIDYFINDDNELCALNKYPIYIKSNGEKLYYGEVFSISNYKHRITTCLNEDENASKIKSPWKLSGEFKDGSIYLIADNKEDEIKNPITFTKEEDGINYIYDIDNSIITKDLKANHYRGFISLIIIVLSAFCVKSFFTILRKHSEIEKLNQTKLDFFTNVIYEVRTSTNSIIGICNDVEKGRLDDTVRGCFDSTKKELKQLLHKVNNMLDITNIKWGRVDACEEEYYMQVLINEISEEYKGVLSTREISWLVDIAENIPIKYRGEKTIVKKIIEHVINNSLGLMIDGHIKISVYGRYASKKEDKMLLTFVISDTGIGIKNESLKELFNISPMKLSVREGKLIEDAKVELAIARQLAIALGGDLKVTSEYGKGSVYTVTLVQNVVDKRIMTPELSSELEDKYRSNLGMLKNIKANVLVVDDNEVNLTVLSNIIKRYGGTVDSAKSGEVAIELAKETDYDILFIDHLMPGIDGVEALRQIRDINKRYKTVPAILVTADTIGNEAIYKKAGFNEYLSKPIAESEISRCLKTMLPIELIECHDIDK